MGASNDCNYAEVNYASYFDHLVTVHKVIGGKEEDEASVVIRQKFRHEIQNDSKQNAEHYNSSFFRHDDLLTLFCYTQNTIGSIRTRNSMGRFSYVVPTDWDISSTGTLSSLAVI